MSSASEINIQDSSHPAHVLFFSNHYQNKTIQIPLSPQSKQTKKPRIAFAQNNNHKTGKWKAKVRVESESIFPLEYLCICNLVFRTAQAFFQLFLLFTVLGFVCF